MNRPRPEKFTDTDAALAALARALGHPARIAILRLLASRARCICGELVDELPLSQATVSQHLRALRRAGLIRGEITGRKRCYCLDPVGVERLSLLLPEFAGRLRRSALKTKVCC